MYVNVINGVILYEEPFTNSIMASILKYGDLAVLYERSDSVETIDGVTDYWYKVGFPSSFGWVFGGYLSERLPPNIPIICGYWEVENSNARTTGGYLRYLFSLSRFSNNSNGNYSIFILSSSIDEIGNWELSGNILTLTATYRYGEGELSIPEIRRYNISIRDNNYFTLRSSSGNGTNLIRGRTWY